MIATCRGCPRSSVPWWYRATSDAQRAWCRTSTTECHCGTCHRHFRNLSGFDAHRREGRCLDPADVGLVEIDGVWATPEGHEAAQRSIQDEYEDPVEPSVELQQEEPSASALMQDEYEDRREEAGLRGRSRYPQGEGFYFSHPQEHGQLRGDR